MYKSQQRFLFGYLKATDQNENDSDIKELYYLATSSSLLSGTRRPKRLLVYGGVRGYKHTGLPTGQRPSEPKYSFMLGDIDTKRLGGIDFAYHSLARYTTNGSDVTIEKQKDIISEIRA